MEDFDIKYLQEIKTKLLNDNEVLTAKIIEEMETKYSAIKSKFDITVDNFQTREIVRLAEEIKTLIAKRREEGNFRG